MHHDVLRLRREQEAKGIEPSQYSEVLKYVLLKRQGTGALPSDAEVSEEFKKRQIYRIPQSYRNFLFERMENCDNAEGKWGEYRSPYKGRLLYNRAHHRETYLCQFGRRLLLNVLMSALSGHFLCGCVMAWEFSNHG